MAKNEIIKIDGYESVVENGGIVWYAVKNTAAKGKQRYRMPSCWANMYDNDHLAISLRRDCPMPELYGESGEFYVPRRTS